MKRGGGLIGDAEFYYAAKNATGFGDFFSRLFKIQLVVFLVILIPILLLFLYLWASGRGSIRVGPQQQPTQNQTKSIT